MSTIKINGNIISGNNIVISKGKIMIDGVDVTPEGKEINIIIDGNIEKLEADACDKIEVKGTVNNLKTMSGDVQCGNVNGSVSTMSGDVKCGTISGSVSTMSGDIKHK